VGFFLKCAALRAIAARFNLLHTLPGFFSRVVAKAFSARMRAHGAKLIGEMQYEDTYRLAYIRGPEGIIVALAEQLG
jgi:hypothetical protein